MVLDQHGVQHEEFGVQHEGVFEIVRHGVEMGPFLGISCAGDGN